MEKSFLFLLSLSSLLLVACNSQDNDSQVEGSTSESQNDDAGTQTYTFNEPFADDDLLTGKLVDIVFSYDDEGDADHYQVNFEVTNNADDYLQLMAREVSINDRMVDEYFYIMGEEVESGQTKEATLHFMSDDGKPLPPLENNIELKLHASNWDSRLEGIYPVIVDFD